MNYEEITIEKDKKIDMYKLYNQFKDEDPFYVGACLAGLDTPETREIRTYLLEHSHDGRRGVAQGLSGVRSEQSYVIRTNSLEECPESVARSLGGDDSDEAWFLREEILKHISEPGVPEGLAESLANLDTPRAWKLRHELMQDKKVMNNILEGLVGVDSEEAWEIREHSLYELPELVAESLLGLSGKRVDKMRKEIARLDRQALLMSYLGSDTKEAWKLRDEFLAINPFVVGTSLVGLYSERAEAMRQELLHMLDIYGVGEVGHKIRKGLLQGLNSNYIFESLK